jgi:hypothetical protein
LTEISRNSVRHRPLEVSRVEFNCLGLAVTLGLSNWRLDLIAVLINNLRFLLFNYILLEYLPFILNKISCLSYELQTYHCTNLANVLFDCK